MSEITESTQTPTTTRVDHRQLLITGICILIAGAVLVAMPEAPIVRIAGGFVGFTGLVIYATGIVTWALTQRTKN